MRAFAVIIICLILAACRSPRPLSKSGESAVTSSSAASLQGDATVHLATGNDYLPFSDESLPSRGLATQLVESVLARAGIPYTVDFTAWNRAEKGVESGRWIATFPYIRSPEREAKFFYSEPMFRITTQLFARLGSNLRIEKLNDLEGLKLCKPIGYAVEATLVPLVLAGKVKVETTPDMEACLRMLRAGRVDAIPESEYTFWPTVDKLFAGDVGGFEVLDFVIQESTLHLIVSRKNPQADRLLEIFNATLREMRANGDLEGLDARNI
jgi:polar amino acid transport system substrate-binding protein